MDYKWLIILYTLLLIDSMGAIIMSWFGQKWWLQYTGNFAKYFPPAKGWSMMYFVLVLIIGYLLRIL